MKRVRSARAATLADVGRVAGVSAMAASAVLNQARTSSRISEETRQRILKAAAQLDYRPNAAARALANRRMQTLGVAAVIEGGELNHYFLEVFNGILAAAATHDQNTTVFALHNWGPDAARLRTICDGRIDGLILVAPTFSPKEKILPAHTPFVSIHANSRLPGVINIESDEERGAFDLVRLLVAQGHHRIMHLAGPAGLIGTERRLRGYRRALAAARLPYTPGLVVETGFSADRGRDTVRQWLRSHPGELLPQAIFSVNDSVAVGAMEALAEAGLRVPDDVSLAGFDDSLAARITVPQLTSVRQPLRAMGIRAVDLLLGRIEHRLPNDAPPVVFPVDIIPRASTRGPTGADRLVPRPR
ncbi:MAG TPA: LacI family DNA-binding transcriptional regulator [Opitutaceae bacterium]|nr:LacI family DNA-binding transcriptional regulator [Opitutaceae bacterium]